MNRPFIGLAEVYHRYRPPLPASVGEYLQAVIQNMEPPHCLLDVGTGTGQVVEALLPYFHDIIALDAEPDMIAFAREHFANRTTSDVHVHFQTVRIEEFTPPPNWKASLVTFCRSFQRVEQDEVLNPLG